MKLGAVLLVGFLGFAGGVVSSLVASAEAPKKRVEKQTCVGFDLCRIELGPGTWEVVFPKNQVTSSHEEEDETVWVVNSRPM